MFRKRKLEVRYVKVKPVSPDEQAAEKDLFDDRLVGVTIMAKSIIQQVTLAGAGYLILDTGRKVAVALASK